MNSRWQVNLKKWLPAHDLIDLAAERQDLFPNRRQFAPEYAQSIYGHMLTKEHPAGDYVAGLGQYRAEISEENRRDMVKILSSLQQVKKYRIATLYLATNMCDRFLASFSRRGHKAPCLIKLAVASILLAAKIEQPVIPSFNKMIKLVNSAWRIIITKQELVVLEANLI